MGGGAKQMLRLCLAVLVFQVCSAATSHIVGDSSGWIIPNSTSFYTSWAAKETFRVGDFLEFKFESGTHTVAEVTKSDYDSCSSAAPMTLLNNGPANITITSAGAHYYICTFAGHCGAGQKLSITATAANSTSSPASAPTPKSAATPSASPAPKSSPAASTSPAGSPTPITSSAPTPSSSASAPASSPMAPPMAAPVSAPTGSGAAPSPVAGGPPVPTPGGGAEVPAAAPGSKTGSNGGVAGAGAGAGVVIPVLALIGAGFLY